MSVLAVLILILHGTPGVQPQTSFSTPSHYIVFDEMGKMASSMAYIHVTVPLNLTNLYHQADLFKQHLITLSTTKTQDIGSVPITKGVNDAARVMLAKLNRTLQRISHLSDILPSLEHSLEKRAALPPTLSYILYSDKSQRALNDQLLDQLRFETAQLQHGIKQLEPDTTTTPTYPNHFWEAFDNSSITSTPTPAPQQPDEQDLPYWARQHYFYHNKYDYLKNEAIRQKRDTEFDYSTDSDTDFVELKHNLSRHKRFLLAAGLAIGILGTFMGIYNQYQITELQKQVSDVEHKHNMLVQITNQHEKLLHKINKNMETFLQIITAMQEYNPGLIYAHLNEHMEGFLDRLTIVERAVQQLQHRRLSTDLLTSEQLQKLHQAVSKVATREGYEPLTTKLGDYFQIEVSYVRTKQDVDIILHVPCVTPNSLLTIYKYVSFPFPLPKGKRRMDVSISESLTAHSLSLAEAMGLFDNSTTYKATTDALYVAQDQSMIAIGRDHRFRMTSQSDLVSCIQRNHIYLCDKHQVVRTDLTNTCLGSLYLRDAEGVRTHCRFEVRAMTETVYQLNNLDHLVFSPTSLTAQITCRNGSLFPVFLNKASRVTVPQSCELKLRSHHITSDTSINIAPPPLQYEWHWDPEAMPSHLLEGSAHLDQQIQALREHLYNTSQVTLTRGDFSNLLTTEISTPNSFLALFWPILLFIIPMVLIALVCGWCYNRYKHRRDTNRRNGVVDGQLGQPMIVIQPACPPTPSTVKQVYPKLPKVSASDSEDEISRLARQ